MDSPDTPLAAFYLQLICSHCGKEFLHGPLPAMRTPTGLPVVPYDIGAETSFSCPDCGAMSHTDELPLRMGTAR